jgi:molecular chaperone DnaJ
MEIAFRDAAFGLEAPLVISRMEACGDCHGSGAQKGSAPRTCPACGGRGRQRFSQGFLMVTRPCSTCGGEGTLIEKPCKACHGEGRLRASRKLEIRIPAGVETGSRLRLTGEGDAGPRGGPAGDLYVVLTVLADEVFEREEDDVVLKLNLPFPTLVLGGEVTVPTLEDPQKISVEPGTAAGTELRLRGKGFGRIGKRGRGDLVVRLGVAIPVKLSPKEADLLRQYAEAIGAPVAKPGVAEKAKKLFS